MKSAAVKEFVEQGGFFLSMVGSPEAGPSRPVLEMFKLGIKPMPVPPAVQERETIPLARFRYPNEEQAAVEFYAAWPVFRDSSDAGGEIWPKDTPRGPVIAGHRMGEGQAFIIGDAAFALKKSFVSFSPNANFWQSLLKNWLGHSADKSPTIEPREGGIINVPKPGKEATP